jgi:dTDP-glucose 4,6-dehydratase
MKKKSIVVTGGLGFIGSNLIEMLLDENYKVINIDKVSYSSSFYNITKYKNNKSYMFYRCNIGNKKKVDYILNKHKPVCIFNLAAETHVDRSIDSPKNFLNSNIFDFYNLLENFRKYFKRHPKVKFIQISTDEVYGDIRKGRSDENNQYKPSSPYAATKAASDLLLLSYIRTYKLPGIITNCSNNYGPRQHPEKLIPKMIYNIINNKKLPLYSNGKNSREWIYVKDHCLALLKVFKKGKIGQIYNIGSNKNLTNLEVIKILINISMKKKNLGNNVKIVLVKDRPGHDFRYALNSKKIKNDLKWKPETKFKDGINETINWYFKNKSFFKSFSKKDIIKRLGKI